MVQQNNSRSTLVLIMPYILLIKYIYDYIKLKQNAFHTTYMHLRRCGMTCLLILKCVSRCLHFKKCTKLYFCNLINLVNAFVFISM